MEANNPLYEQLKNNEAFEKQMWPATVEDFAVFVFMSCSAARPEMLSADPGTPLYHTFLRKVEETAELFMQGFEVNLFPYTSFMDILESEAFAERMLEVSEKCMSGAREMLAVQEATENNNIEVSKETQEEIAISQLFAQMLMQQMVSFDAPPGKPC